MRALERFFVIGFLLCAMQVVSALSTPSLGENDPEVFSGDLHMTELVTEAFVYGSGAFLVLRRWRRVLHAARLAWPLLTFPALAALSTLWSTQPGLTMRRSATLLVFILFSILSGRALHNGTARAHPGSNAVLDDGSRHRFLFCCPRIRG